MVSGNILDMFCYSVALRLSDFTGHYSSTVQPKSVNQEYIFVTPISRAVKDISEKVSHKMQGRVIGC